MLSLAEYDFCDTKQELDYILNTVNNINHISTDNSKELKQLNDRLSRIEERINERCLNRQDVYFKKDIVFLAVFATILIAMF